MNTPAKATLDTSNIIEIVSSHLITDLLFLDIQTFDTAYPEPLGELEELGVVLHQRVSAQETLLGLRSIHQIAGIPFTRLRSHNLAIHQRRLKRLFDLLLLLTVSPIVLPLIIFFFIYVVLSNVFCTVPKGYSNKNHEAF